MAADAEVIKNAVECIRRNFIPEFAKRNRMDNKLGENACEALRCKLDRFIVAVKSMQSAFGTELLSNSVRMAATPKGAVHIHSIGPDVQTIKTFLEHHRIVIEFSPLNSSNRSFGNFVYMY